MSDITGRLVFSKKYGISRNSRYDLNYKSFGSMMLFEFTLFNSSIYSFTMLRSKKAATL